MARNFWKAVSSNSSLCDADSSKLFTAFSIMSACMTMPVGMVNMATISSVSLFLVVPACILVLYLGHRRWRRPGVAAMTHFDFFTYVTAVANLLKFLGALVISCAAFAGDVAAVNATIFVYAIIFCAEVGLHILTCVDRHLAAVHPVAYRRLRNKRGVRMRNVAMGGLWLLAVVGGSVQLVLSFRVILMVYVGYVCLAIGVVSFCSVSVLRVLTGPRPGEGGRAGPQADQSKLRAFYTITAILGVLLVKFGGNIVSATMYKYTDLLLSVKCGLWLSELWLSLPCSLVLPLLFLHRAGNLPRR